jgi:hypothetical protein
MLAKLSRAVYGPTKVNENVDIWGKIAECFALSGRSNIGIVEISPNVGFTTINEKEYFIKISKYSDFYNLSLVKEYLILKQLYSWLDIELLNYSADEHKPQYVLMIEKLDKLNRGLSLDEIEFFISESSSRFHIKEYLLKSKEYVDSNVSIFLNPVEIFSESASVYSVELNKAGLLHENLLKETINITEEAAEYTRGKKLCHGDLHMNNLYQKNGQVIILDWEDAFLGNQLYDICMWATFINNRKHIPEVLNKYIGSNSLMALIIIIKSYIGFLNGDYQNYNLSINDRLNEVIKM